MIPKKIHQIWYQGVDSLPEKYIKNAATWRQNHPNWEYLLWDKHSMDDLIQGKYPEYLSMYQQFTYMHQKIDICKYLILWDQGGVYADMDTVSLRPLSQLLCRFPESKVLVSLGAGNNLENLLLTGQQIMVNNGIIISTAKHPFFHTVIKRIAPCSDLEPKIHCINTSTGPKMFTQAVMEYLNTGDKSLTLLPNKYLEPCFGLDIQCKSNTESFANHIHEQSWVNPSLRWFMTIYYWCKNHPYYSLVILFGLVWLFKRS